MKPHCKQPDGELSCRSLVADDSASMMASAGGGGSRDHPSVYFQSINERPVDDISLEFFYKPHTLTLLIVSILALVYSALTRNDTASVEANIWSGLQCMVFFFLIVSVLTFPNGPFTRPHPAIWRMVFGMSVLYAMALLFLLFQDYKTVKAVLQWSYPDLRNFSIDQEKEYGVNCSNITLERVWGHVDFFAFGHFFGWAMKAVLVRHYGILWTISVMWEITEVAFAHLLPNFIECWWDALVLDIILCNGLGIWFGMIICKKLEMRAYKWESIKNIQTTTGKIRRAVLQFTPSSWTHVRWLDPNCTYMRFVAVCELVIVWQVSELNTFFLKHIFEIPPDHPLCVGRILLIGVIVAPSIRQYYVYVTDTRCRRVGTQCWVFGAITFIEAIICVKFGSSLFAQTEIINIVIWLIVQLVMSVVCVYVCVLWNKRSKKSPGSSNLVNKTDKYAAIDDNEDDEGDDDDDDDDDECPSEGGDGQTQADRLLGRMSPHLVLTRYTADPKKSPAKISSSAHSSSPLKTRMQTVNKEQPLPTPRSAPTVKKRSTPLINGAVQ